MEEASLIVQLVKNPPAMQETPVRFLCWEDPWRRARLPTPVFLGFPCGSAGKESACHAGDLGSILGLGRSPGEEKGYPLQYSGLQKSMDCIDHGVTKKRTWLSDFHFHEPVGDAKENKTVCLSCNAHCLLWVILKTSQLSFCVCPLHWKVRSLEFQSYFVHLNPGL